MLDGIRELTRSSLSGVNVEKWTSYRVEPLLVSRTFLWAVLGMWGPPGLSVHCQSHHVDAKNQFPPVYHEPQLIST